ncbi:MAG: major facilitator superfamily 1 [Betaproteobacteria bacterium]|nr:major facilitator superfamily 1 [Betaproteobacteria bacterium]
MLTSLVKVEPSETRAVVWSFLYFFALLSSYYILRPVREEMGIQAGIGNLAWLFTATFCVMLAAVPLFGWLSARLPRRTLLPLIYGFFGANLVIFFVAFQIESLRVQTAQAFFVWLSVFNLFVVSVFWSFMVDLYTEAQGKRLFGFIAAGGTTGAIVGPAITASVVKLTGPVPLLLISAALLGFAIFCISRLNAWAAMEHRRGASAASARGEPVGGSIWAGVRSALGSPYLLGICAYLLCYTVLSTLIYVETLRLIAEAYDSPATRTQLFAGMDLGVNALTLVMQLTLTARMFERFGVTVTLALLPAFALIGFAALAVVPLLAILVIFGVIRRAGEFALSKPAREILFTVLPRAEKYKAKNFIDTVVYRGGDAASGWFSKALREQFGLTLSAVSCAALPIAAAWVAVALWLGRRHKNMAAPSSVSGAQ